jgi:hypothetical protein
VRLAKHTPAVCALKRRFCDNGTKLCPPAASCRLGLSRNWTPALSCSIAARKFAASSIPRLLFPTLHDLCERDPTANEEAQHRQYDHAIRRHRKIVWATSCY